MKVLHITPYFYPAHRCAAHAQSVYRLARALARSGCRVRVLTTDADGPDDAVDVDTWRDVELGDGVVVRYCRRRFGDWGSPALIRRLRKNVRWADVVHLTAAPSAATLPVLWACRLLGTKLVWSPCESGESNRWTQECARAAPRDSLLHFTSGAAPFRSGFEGFPQCVIPEPIEFPVSVEHTPGDGVLRLLARSEPSNGARIDRLLEACRRVHPDIAWRLTLASDGEPADEEFIRRRVEEFGLDGLVRTPSRAEASRRPELFSSADLFVAWDAPSDLTAGYQALAHGVPLLAEAGVLWQQVEEVGCGILSEFTDSAIAGAIARASRMRLGQMGRCGRTWVAREFALPVIAGRTVAMYRDALAGERTRSSVETTAA